MTEKILKLLERVRQYLRNGSANAEPNQHGHNEGKEFDFALKKDNPRSA